MPARAADMSNPRLLVSYARRDGREISRSLSERLVNDHGFTVWRDLSDLEGGGDWWKQITEAIRCVEYLILVITPAALESRIVRDEWRFARANGVCVIPVIGSPHFDMTHVPAWMRRTHFVDPRDTEQWTRLVRTLEGPCHSPRVPMMAEPLPEDFVERPREFDTLKALLIDEVRAESVAITTALRGAGGFGKTTLARALCHDEAVVETFYDGVLWLTFGETPGDAGSKLEDLIVLLSGAPSGLTSAEARRSRLASLLDDRHLLLVLDDVWNAAHVQPFLLGGTHCARLITTRDSQTLPAGTREVRLDAMHLAEAVALLGSGLTGADARVLAGLAARLGEWPLLLKLVNGMLRDRVLRTHDTIQSAVAYVNRLLDKRGLKAFDARDPVQRHDAVSATVEASVARLSDDEWARFRELVVFPEDADIPLDVVQLLWQRTGSLDDIECEQLLQALASLSLLLDFNIGERRVRIHDVIRAYVIGGLHPTEMEALNLELVEAYRMRCPTGWASGPDDGYFHRSLPFHLAAAGHAAELRALLLEPEWIESKLRRTDVAAVLSDYRSWANDSVTHLLESAVTLSADVIARAPDAVLPQLLARLDPVGSPELTELTRQWRTRRRPAAWLCPLTVSLEKAGGVLVQTLQIEMSYGIDWGMLSLSDDGRYLAVTYNRSVQVFDLVSRLRLLKEKATAAALTADGRLLVVGIGWYVAMHDVATGKEVWSSQSSEGSIRRLDVTPDGRWIVGSSGRNFVHVWGVKVDGEAFVLERQQGIEHFAIAPDGDRIAISLPGGTVEVWNVDRRLRLARWICSESAIRALRFGAGDEVVVGSAGGTVETWTLNRDWGATTICGRDVEGRSVAVTPTGRLIVVGFDDGNLECWRLDEDGRQTLTPLIGGWRLSMLDYLEASVRAIAITPNGHWLVSAAGGGAVHVWDLSNATSDEEATRRGRILQITPDGRQLLFRYEDGSVAIRDTLTQEDVSFLEESLREVDLMTPDGRWVAVTRPDGRVSLWCMKTGKCLSRLAIGGRIFTCAFMPSTSRVANIEPSSAGIRVISGLGTGRLRASRLAARPELQGHVHAVTVLPNTERVVAILSTGIVMFDLAKGASTVTVVPLPVDSLFENQHIRASTNGQLLTLWYHYRAAVFELLTGTKILEVDGGDAEIITSAILSPNGRRLIVAHGRRVRVWSLESRAEEAVFYSDAPIAGVACPSDDLFIAGSVGGHLHRLEFREAGR